MEDIVQFVGPKHSLQLFGVKLIGINAESGTKLLFSGVRVLVLLGPSRLLQAGARLFTGRSERYVWEELSIQVAYRADRLAAERVLLDVVEKHSLPISRLGERALAELERRHVMRRADIRPRVYWRMTDNWVEMTVRFLAEDHGVRELKDAMSRDILAGLDNVGIGIASATFEITGLPEVSLRRVAR